MSAPASPPAPAAAAAVSADSLDDELLLAIFQLVCARARPHGCLVLGGGGLRPAGALASVCRRWRRLAGSEHLWGALALSWGAAPEGPDDRAGVGGSEEEPGCESDFASARESEGEGEGEGEEDAMAAAPVPPPPPAAAPARGRPWPRDPCAWLRARAPGLRALTVSGTAPRRGELAALLSDVCRAAPRLAALRIEDATGDAAPLLAAAAGAAALEALALRRRAGGGVDGRERPLAAPARALAALAALPRLRRLDLLLDAMPGAPADLAVWSALAGLTALSFGGGRETLVLPAEAVAGLRGLRRLALSSVRVAPLPPAAVAALGRVSRLELRAVLAARPRRGGGAALWGALKELPELRTLVVEEATADAAMPAAALACPALRSLTLRDCRALAAWPDAGAPPRAALEALHFEECSLTRPGPPAALFERQLRGLTSLTWRAVRAARSEAAGARWRLGRLAHLGAPGGRAGRLRVAALPALKRLRYEWMDIATLGAPPAGLAALPPALAEVSLNGSVLGLPALSEAPWWARWLAGAPGLTRLALGRVVWEAHDGAIVQSPAETPAGSPLAELRGLRQLLLSDLAGSAPLALALRLPALERLHARYASCALAPFGDTLAAAGRGGGERAEVCPLDRMRAFLRAGAKRGAAAWAAPPVVRVEGGDDGAFWRGEGEEAEEYPRVTRAG
jgi:hypothetical protein